MHFTPAFSTKFLSSNEADLSKHIGLHGKEKAAFIKSLLPDLNKEMPTIAGFCDDDRGPFSLFDPERDVVKSGKDGHDKGKQAVKLIFKLMACLGNGSFFEKCDQMLGEFLSLGFALFFSSEDFHMDVLKGFAKGFQETDIDELIEESKMTVEQAYLIKKIFIRLRAELLTAITLERGKELETYVIQKKGEYAQFADEVKSDTIKIMPALAQFLIAHFKPF